MSRSLNWDLEWYFNASSNGSNSKSPDYIFLSDDECITNLAELEENCFFYASEKSDSQVNSSDENRIIYLSEGKWSAPILALTAVGDFFWKVGSSKMFWGAFWSKLGPSKTCTNKWAHYDKWRFNNYSSNKAMYKQLGYQQQKYYYYCSITDITTRTMEHVHTNSYNICMHVEAKKRDIKHTKGSNISSKGSRGSWGSHIGCWCRLKISSHFFSTLAFV